MAVHARLYDAEGLDREVTLDRQVLEQLGEKQILWIDLDAFEEAEVQQTAALLQLPRQAVFNLLQRIRRPRLDIYGGFFHLNIGAVKEVDGRYKTAELDFIIASTYIVTLHHEPIEFLESFDRQVKGDSHLGHLDTSSFLAALLDWHITSFFRITERLDTEIDRLDEQALHPYKDRDLLNDMMLLRRRVGQVRRALVPHREVYAALARPDFTMLSGGTDAAEYFRALNDRLDRAIEAVENARELLVGSFEMFTTKATLRTNQTMKILTLVSVTLLPAGVITGVMSLTIPTPIYNTGHRGFWIMLFLIAAVGATTLMLARRKRWI